MEQSMARSWVLAVVCLPALAAEPAPTLDQALNHLYNFDFPASQRILSRYIAEHPHDALPYAFRASAYLFTELDRMGILESEFLIDDHKIASKTEPVHPDPATAAHFQRAVEMAQDLGETALKANPDDREALFALSVTGGLATDYMALVEKHQFMSLSLAKRSNAYAQRLLRLDPTFYDAYLTAGFSEYMVASLPFFIRWFVHFDNVSGSKEQGVRNLELAASSGHYFRPFAQILLGIIDLRNKRLVPARDRLEKLVRQYPENPLFRKELGKLNEKIGMAAN
jgi:tetratricopeptide (TPR) repeat protein